MPDVTEILNAIESGDANAVGQLLPLVYDELRRLAASHLADEKPGHTLDATALVHEAWLRLVPANPQPAWANRRHFFGTAAEAMRRILVENARRKHRLKRGGDRLRLDLDELNLAADDTADDVLALDAALDELATEEPQVARVVHLRYFAGQTIEETAAALD